MKNINTKNYTCENPVHYEKIDANDPNRQQKLKDQRDKFMKDAEEGKVVCLTDLFANHGM